jgi:hypothetical protein
MTSAGATSLTPGHADAGFGFAVPQQRLDLAGPVGHVDGLQRRADIAGGEICQHKF